MVAGYFYFCTLSTSDVAAISNNTAPATTAEIKLELLNHLKINPNTATTNKRIPNQRSNFINNFIEYIPFIIIFK